MTDATDSAAESGSVSQPVPHNATYEGATVTDDWPIIVYGSAQEPEQGNLQCGRCYSTFWESSGSSTTLAELRAAVDAHRQVCKGAGE